jgi:hypothetical protein
VAALLLLSSPAWAGTSDATVGMTATVDSFAEWADASPSIVAGDWTGSVDGTTISKVGEYLTVTKGLTLYANANVTLTATAVSNSGVATLGSDNLTTSYKITGDVGTPDVAYKAAGTGGGQFFNAGNTYAVTHVPGDGSYAISLGVKLESAANRAQDAGNYTCSIKLTATW